jgi:hypothetical protein
VWQYARFGYKFSMAAGQRRAKMTARLDAPRWQRRNNDDVLLLPAVGVIAALRKLRETRPGVGGRSRGLHGHCPRKG